MRLRQESNDAGVQFLFTELATAHTFLDIADVTESAETRDRNLRNAYEAYSAAMRYSPGVALTVEQAADLGQKIRDLKARLAGAGYDAAF